MDEVTRLEYGVVYHATHVGRLLKAIHWTPQRPMRRVRQRDEMWLAIKKGQMRGSRQSS
jgi:transposase